MWPYPTFPASRMLSCRIPPSGTEALIRVMVEAKTTEIAHQVASVLADFIKKL